MNVEDKRHPHAGGIKRYGCWPQCVQDNGTWLCPLTWVILAIGTLLILILVPLTFEYVEYSNWGFKKNDIDNKVDTSRVYGNGQYAWGPSFGVQTFPRHYVREELELAIFPSNGLEFTIGIVFYWRVIPEELHTLFEKFGTTYQTQIEARANAKIKNAAPQFTIQQYIQERPLITQTLYQALKTELEIIHIEVPAPLFNLVLVELPEEIRQRDEDAAVRTQLNIKQQNEQQADLVRKETERQVRGIDANTTLVGITARADADRLLREAYALSNRTITDGDSFGSNNFFTALSITDPATKAVFIRTYALEESLQG